MNRQAQARTHRHMAGVLALNSPAWRFLARMRRPRAWDFEIPEFKIRRHLNVVVPALEHAARAGLTRAYRELPPTEMVAYRQAAERLVNDLHPAGGRVRALHRADSLILLAALDDLSAAYCAALTEENATALAQRYARAAEHALSCRLSLVD